MQSIGALLEGTVRNLYLALSAVYVMLFSTYLLMDG